MCSQINKRIIFHIDVNSAFLSWTASHMLHRLNKKVDIRTIPAIIGGSIEHRHGIVLAKSIPAKTYKIHTGESVIEAQKKCPELLILPPHYDLYDKCSKSFINMLKEYSPCVEQYSIDEAFIDMTGVSTEPEKIAHEIKNRIRDELGFTVNIGISENKILAKMAGEIKKPDMVHTLYPNELPAKMWPLPTSELFFCGRATTKKLANLGILTIGQIAETNTSVLKSHLKKHGEILWQFANGYDYSAVEPVPPKNKGYGNSTTTRYDVCDIQTAKLVLLSLAETVSARLRRDNVKIKVVSISIRDTDLKFSSHQRVLTNKTNITNEIHQISVELLKEHWDGRPLRHLGIHTSKVSEDNLNIRQLKLFDSTDYDKLNKMDNAIDQIRKRYGKNAVMRACFLNTKTGIEAMSGGISTEKRKTDYSIY